MLEFEYQGVQRNGAKASGIIEANDRAQAIKILQTQGVFVSDIRPNKSKSESLQLFKSTRIKLQDLEYLTSELSLLLKNGVKIDKGLSILNSNAGKKPSARLIASLLSSVRKGSTLSAAMEDQDGVFSRLYVNLVKLGEASGDLPMVFERLSQDLKFQRELKDKIVQALTYPLVILFVCVLCILFVFNYIVPEMESLFADSDELPVYTSALLGASKWFQDYQWFLAIGLVIGGFTLKYLYTIPLWQRRFSRVLAALPGIGTVLVLTEQIRFNSALCMMTKAGLKIDSAVKLSSESISNISMKSEMEVAYERIRGGTTLSETFRNTALYPEFSISLLEVGEESGDLSPVFEELAARAKNQFESTISKLTSVLEPLLILIMGGIVGSVVVTMLLSIVSVNDVGF